MKKTNMKTVTIATALMLLLSLPFAGFAQEENRGLFGRGGSSADYSYGSGGGLMKQGDPVSINDEGSGITNDPFGAPLGSGIAILLAAGAGYAVVRCKRSRKNTTLLLACLVLLGFTQCKKEQPLEPDTQGEKVSITLTVDGGNSNDSRVNVDPPHVTFEQGDKILVGYDGKYVGTITHDGTSFSGEINATVTTPKQKLYFFFVGNKDDVNLSVGNSTCTIDISDQTAELPVLSFSESDQDFNGAGSYSAKLHNQCSLVQFTTNDIPVWTTVSITGMKNKATVNFGTNSITPTGETGSIALHAKDKTSRWAILLPQDQVTNASASAIGYNSASNINVPSIDNDAYLTGEGGVNFSMTEGPFDALHTPLTFEAKVAGATVTFTPAETLSLPLEYSINGGAWEEYSSAVTLTHIGDKVSFRGNNATYAVKVGYASVNHSSFSCSANCFIYGNVMSLIDKENYSTNKTLTADYTFYFLFYGNNRLFSHTSKDLVLPATTLTSSCYSNMFGGCRNITTAPALPATTLASYCYSGMFYNCSGITTAPVLAATTLASGCYNEMFVSTNLTTAPELPATTLANECYKYMFWNCKNLTAAPALPAETLKYYCYGYMFRECTNLTEAPALPATTLANYCYYQMFQGCSNLSSVTCLATNISASYCTTDWLDGVSATGTFTKAASMESWTEGSASGIPSNWTVIPIITGKFSVSATKQVYFSSGNLQATTSDLGENWTWAFATNQWDYIGNNTANNKINGNGTVSTNGTVDLFGWVGASSTWTGAAQYGISNSTTTNNTNGYGNVNNEALKSDWGNTISDGYTWRTLSSAEWTYVFNTRTSGSTVNETSNARYTHATINTDGTSVNGIILFPDGVTIANGEATSWGTVNGDSGDSFWNDATKCTAAQWTALAAKGCVFLPAAGYREGSMVIQAGSSGGYWSSAPYNTNKAYFVNLGPNYLYPDANNSRHTGRPVRLVRDAN